MTTYLPITAGQTLTARSIGDHECIFSAKVLTRKGHFVTLAVEGYPGTRRKKVELDYEGTEVVYALGKYSMAPTFRARQ